METIHQSHARVFKALCDPKRLAILELGVGYTMPELIRFPFEQIVMNHKRAKLIRINTMHPLCVEENNHKAICVGADIAQVLPVLLDEQHKGGR